MDDWMTDEHKAAALEGFLGNPVAVEYARQQGVGYAYADPIVKAVALAYRRCPGYDERWRP